MYLEQQMHSTLFVWQCLKVNHRYKHLLLVFMHKINEILIY